MKQIRSGVIGGFMQFKNIHALLGWAFQMVAADVTAAACCYSDEVRGANGLTGIERLNLALDVLAKVGRLPGLEQAVITARFTLDQRAVNAAAVALPPIWATGLRRELARAWADDCQLARSQAEIGETYMRSQPTIHRNWRDACRTLGRHYQLGVDTLEVQLLDLLRSASRCNTHRDRLAA